MPSAFCGRPLFLAMIVLAAFVGRITVHSAAADEPPVVESYLSEARLADADAELSRILVDDPGDDQARFSLGVVQFLSAIEFLGQSHYRYGLLQELQLSLPLLRLPVPYNETPEPLTYAQARESAQEFLNRLATAEATLADVDTADVKLPLHFGRIRLDLDHNGKGELDEALWKIFSRFNRGRGVAQPQGEEFLITFDGGDVHWLRGYCHLLSAIAEFYLAYDSSDLFHRVGRRLFAQAEVPYDFLPTEEPQANRWDTPMLLDLIALIHCINFELAEPERLQAVHQHLLDMVDQSRASWKLILAEADDDHEWVPNPKQVNAAIPNARVEQQMVDSWHEFLDEGERLLKGERLVPFWRGSKEYKATHGVNLRRVFAEPRRFDLVLWVQGTDAAPYIEEGQLTNPEVWRRLRSVFGGEFFGFAIWFN